MPAPYKPKHLLVLDYAGDGSFSTDISDLVEIGEINWGSDAASAISEIRPVTASGSIVVLNDGSIPIEDQGRVVEYRLYHDTADLEHLVHWGRLTPAVHEQLTYPDFLAWSVEGRHGAEHRTCLLYTSPSPRDS